MDHPESKKAGSERGAGGAPGARAPAKGESSASDITRPDQTPLPGSSDNSPLESDLNTLGDDNTFVDDSPAPTGSSNRARRSAIHQRHQLQAGAVFGGRYEILQVLGEGGMGTVYKARDREVEHLVALKLIRPDMAAHPIILARFKQELLTARQVTHRNVIRIYDMAEADGAKYITMEFVEGCDLRKLLHDKGKLAPQEAVDIMRQVCLALEAAHGAGVIHRDLKPQNIMQENHGRILVMDFGLARSLESDGVTQSGVLLGTIEYMSPEQAMGKHLDARSDLFTLGLIFYELLTGKVPYKADTAMASLLMRNQERAVPVSDLDSTVPKGLSDIVSKCLERDLNLRYQNVKEILADLDAWEGKRPVSASVVSAPAPRTVIIQVGGRTIPWKWVAAGAAGIAVAVGAWVYIGKTSNKVSSAAVAGPQVSLAILPFHNNSGDAKLDWLGNFVAATLKNEVGESPQVRTVSSDPLRRMLDDLHISPGSDIDAATVKRIADSSAADTLISGQFVRYQDKIQLNATLRDIKRQKNIPLQAEAPNEQQLLPAIKQLAQSIQKNLALAPNLLEDLRAKTVHPSSDSLPALRSYNEGIEFSRQGNALEAAKRFQTAVDADPKFALAYSRLGLAYSALRNDAEAQRFSQRAVDLSDPLPAPEKYLIQANYAQATSDYRKALESYETLEKASPEDADVHFHLGELYESSGNFDKARAELARVLAGDPNRVDALIAAGRVEIKSGNPAGALENLNRASTRAIALNNLDGKATILNAMGAAYEQLNKPDDAMVDYNQALQIRRRLDQNAGVALTLGNIARVQASMGKPNDAYKSYNEAEKLQREIGDKKGLGVTLINLGQLYTERSKYDEALKAFKESLEINRAVGDEYRQALCLNNIGNVYMARGQSSDSLTYFEGALALRKKLNLVSETGETLHNLGEAALKSGDYGQSLDYHLKALELFRNSGDKSGAAIQSYSMGTIFEYQGRYGAALKSKEEALKTYRELQDRGFWMGEILSGYGHSLAQVGRYDDAQTNLTEAMTIAKDLQNKTLIAQILGFQGDSSFYRGDLKVACDLFAQAVAASGSADVDKDVALLSRFNAAKCLVEDRRYAAATNPLKTVVQQAEALGAKNISTNASLYLAEAQMNLHQYPAAQKEIEAAQAAADKLGLQVLQARAQFLSGRILELTSKPADASPHYATAKRILDGIRQESGSEAIAKRQDLAGITAR